VDKKTFMICFVTLRFWYYPPSREFVLLSVPMVGSGWAGEMDWDLDYDGYRAQPPSLVEIGIGPRYVQSGREKVGPSVS
jgi:hypothetical protein